MTDISSAPLPLSDIAPGTPVVVGSRIVPMPTVADGDRVLAVGRTGDLLVVPADALAAAEEAVADAASAFVAMRHVDDAAVSAFFAGFAARLADETVWASIADANAADVADARARGRHVGRLQATPKMRDAMVDGLRGWAAAPCRIGEVLESRAEATWTVERRRAPLGVVAFVFEGRPNVFADGAGVLRNRNTAVMRIGADALGTALAIESEALAPALAEAGLPTGAVRLVRSKHHGAGQALFSLAQVRLAVARGSGPTVALLGSIAEQHGIPASLHGTGGAWVVVDATASPEVVANVVRNSLDRKVCNTLNTLVFTRDAVGALSRVAVGVLDELGAVVHVSEGAEGSFDGVDVRPAAGLAEEFEWDDVPELHVAVADDVDAAVALVNQWSPHFVASLLTSDPDAFDAFYAAVDAPYVGNAFTRWVDGQWAWDRPELGLTNWERGRLLGRSGILSGDDIATVRDVFRDTTGRAPQAR